MIGEDKVYNLTTSFNGVGKSTALMIAMPDTAARAIRDELEALWRVAKPLAQGLAAVNDDVVEAGNSESPTKTIHAEGDRFVHDGCTVKHKKRESAVR